MVLYIQTHTHNVHSTNRIIILYHIKQHKSKCNRKSTLLYLYEISYRERAKVQKLVHYYYYHRHHHHCIVCEYFHSYMNDVINSLLHAPQMIKTVIKRSALVLWSNTNVSCCLFFRIYTWVGTEKIVLNISHSARQPTMKRDFLWKMFHCKND